MNQKNRDFLINLAFSVQDMITDADDFENIENHIRTECQNAEIDFDSTFSSLKIFIDNMKSSNDSYEQDKLNRHPFLRKHKDAAINVLNVSSGLNLSTNDKELGIGMNGLAYKSSDNTVIKVTGDVSEFLFARLLMLKGSEFNHFPKIHNAIAYRDGVYVIHLELLDTSSIKWIDFNKWKEEFSSSDYDWENYVKGSHLPQEIDPSQDALKCFNVFRKVWNITKEWNVQIDIEELRLNNLGIRNDGTFVLYDQGLIYDDEKLLDYVYELCDKPNLARLGL